MLLVLSSLLDGMTSVDLCFSVSFSLLALYAYFRKPNPYASLPLPPGPKGWPVIGNLFDMPTGFEWKTFHEWSRKFGAVCFTKD